MKLQKNTIFQSIIFVGGKKDVIEDLEQEEKLQIWKWNTIFFNGFYLKKVQSLNNKFKSWQKKCHLKKVSKQVRDGLKDFTKETNF